MAEVLLKVGSVVPGDQTTYQDGDIICAFHDDRISCCHLQLICFPRDAQDRAMVDGAGYRIDPDGLARQFLDQLMQARFERVSRTEVKRIELSTGDEEVFSDTPNAKGQHIDVPTFVARRLAHAVASKGGGLPVFGSPGAEIWYGGDFTPTTAKLSAIWDYVETHTALRRVDHQLWPLSPTEKRHMLALSVDDFNQTERTRLEACECDEVTGQLITKRKCFVGWDSLSLGTTPNRIRNHNIEIDLRDPSLALQRSLIVQEKS